MNLEPPISCVVRTALFVTGLVVFGGRAEAATVTLDFEGFPDSAILTTQYPGVTFMNAIILTAGISLNEFEFPPHSGVNVVSDNGGPMTIDFSTPITSFGGYFTYLELLTLDGFNAAHKEVASATSLFSDNLACLGGPPCLGDPGSSPNEFIQLSFTGGISSVTITGNPAGGSFTLDDATYTTASATTVPEPTAPFLISIGIVLLAVISIPKKISIAMKRSLIILIAIAAVLIGGGILLVAAHRVGEPKNLPQSTQQSTTTPNVGTPVATPSIIAVNASTTVTVTVQIAEPTLIPGSVNLLLLGATGTQPTILGVMQNAGNGTFSLQSIFDQATPGQLQLQVSAAFRGQLRRVVSQITTVAAWSALADTTSGFQTLYPPVLYNLTNTTSFGGFLLQSSPRGVDIGGEGPEDGSNATTSGFSIVITPTQYSDSFDIANWISTQYPYSDDTLTTTTIGGELAYQIVFQNEVGAGEPTVVVYHSGYVYTISYASTFALGSSADQSGLSAFNAVLQNFQFSR
jgi:hypothetical protein